MRSDAARARGSGPRQAVGGASGNGKAYRNVGSKRSRSQSPSRLMEGVVMMTAMPGKAAIR